VKHHAQNVDFTLKHHAQNIDVTLKMQKCSYYICSNSRNADTSHGLL